MTDKEALEVVFNAAVEYWARDTSNQTLKLALQIVGGLVELYPTPTLEQLAHWGNKAKAHELEKVQSNNDAAG